MIYTLVLNCGCKDIENFLDDLQRKSQGVSRTNSIILFLKNLLFTVLVPGIVAVALPLIITRDRTIQFRWITIPGWPLLIVGAVIYCWCVWDFASFGRVNTSFEYGRY